MPGIIFLSDVLLTIIALTWLAAAAIQDIRRREVANWLNFSLVAIGLGIRGIAAIVASEPFYFLYALVFLAVFFVLANIFYYSRIFAGGDAKLLIALGVVFATTPSFAAGNQAYQTLQFVIPFSNHFLMSFFVNILFVGSFYGICWSIILAAMNRKSFLREFKIEIRKNNLNFICLFLAAIFVILALVLKEIVFLIIGTGLVVLFYLFLFIKSVENSCMIKAINPKKLAEGDWLARAVRLKISRKSSIIRQNWQGLSGKEIRIIKRARIKSVLIKQGVPFVPVFLIALIISFFKNLLLFFVQFLI